MQIGADVVAAILAFVAGVAWLVRLEGRITRAEERHTDLRGDVGAIDRKTEDYRREVSREFRSVWKKFDEGKVYVFRKDSPGDRGE